MNRLIFHFSLNQTSRHKHFKYLVLLLDECLCRKAYEDAIKLGQRAEGITVSRTELKLLQSVISAGMDDLEQLRQAGSLENHGTTSVRIDHREKFVIAFKHLDGKIKARISTITSNVEATVDLDGERSLTRTGLTRQTSRKLTWQP